MYEAMHTSMTTLMLTLGVVRPQVYILKDLLRDMLKILKLYMNLSQPHFEGVVRSPLTLLKMGLGSPPRLPKI
jgi:hypothetical protein